MSELVFDWTEEVEQESPCNGRRATKEKMRSDSRDSTIKRKRIKHNSGSSTSSSSSKAKKPVELELDLLVLQRRQKQIDYGKNTVGYQNYTTQVAITQRKKDDPQTPDKYSKYSRRSWDMLIKIWRKKLHEYDVDSANEENSQVSDQESVK